MSCRICNCIIPTPFPSILSHFSPEYFVDMSLYSTWHLPYFLFSNRIYCLSRHYYISYHRLPHLLFICCICSTIFSMFLFCALFPHLVLYLFLYFMFSLFLPFSRYFLSLGYFFVHSPYFAPSFAFCTCGPVIGTCLVYLFHHYLFPRWIRICRYVYSCCYIFCGCHYELFAGNAYSCYYIFCGCHYVLFAGNAYVRLPMCSYPSMWITAHLPLAAVLLLLLSYYYI